MPQRLQGICLSRVPCLLMSGRVWLLDRLAAVRGKRRPGSLGWGAIIGRHGGGSGGSRRLCRHELVKFAAAGGREPPVKTAGAVALLAVAEAQHDRAGRVDLGVDVAVPDPSLNGVEAGRIGHDLAAVGAPLLAHGEGEFFGPVDRELDLGDRAQNLPAPVRGHRAPAGFKQGCEHHRRGITAQ